MKRILFIIMVVSVILNINAMFLYSQEEQEEIVEEVTVEGEEQVCTETTSSTKGLLCKIECDTNPEPYNGSDCYKECWRIVVDKTCWYEEDF